jgi:hypothetical protein
MSDHHRDTAPRAGDAAARRAGDDMLDHFGMLVNVEQRLRVYTLRQAQHQTRGLEVRHAALGLFLGFPL